MSKCAPLSTDGFNPALQNRTQLSLSYSSTIPHLANAKMKVIVSLMLAPLAAASVAMKYGMDLESAAAPFVSNSTGASCGIGYTYCGYILKQQKSMPPCPFCVRRVTNDRPQTLMMLPSSLPTALQECVTLPMAPRRPTPCRPYSCVCPRRRCPRRGMLSRTSHTLVQSRSKFCVRAVAWPLGAARMSVSTRMQIILVGAVRLAPTSAWTYLFCCWLRHVTAASEL